MTTIDDRTGEIPVLMATAVDQWIPQLVSERWPEPSIRMPRSTRATWEHQTASPVAADHLFWTITPPLSERWDDFVTETSAPAQLPFERLLPYPEPARLATAQELLMLDEYREQAQAVKWPRYLLTLATGIAVGMALGGWLLSSC